MTTPTIRAALAALALALLAIASPLAPAARAADTGSAAPADADKANPPPPVPVTLGFHITAVRDVDVRAQSFNVDLYLWMRYPVQAPAKDGKDAASSEGKKEGEEPEIEKFEFPDAVSFSKVELERKRLGADQYICWRVTGNFHFTARLKDYPFDTQLLDLAIEHPSMDASQLVYVDDAASYQKSGAAHDMAGVKDGLDIPEFTLKEVLRGTIVSRYSTDFGDTSSQEPYADYSRFIVRMRFSRDFMPYFAKIVIPLIVILSMAYLAFLIPAKEIQSASGLVVTALLSTIAFNVAVSQTLPEVGYLVVSDKFFIATYFLLLFALAETVLTYKWDDEGHKEYAHKWDVVGKWAYPLLCLAVFIYLLIQALGSD